MRTDALDYTGDRLLEGYLYPLRGLEDYKLEYRTACSTGFRLPNAVFEAMNLLPGGRFFSREGSILLLYIITPHTWNMDPFILIQFDTLAAIPFTQILFQVQGVLVLLQASFNQGSFKDSLRCFILFPRFPDPNPAILYSAAGAGEWAASG